MMILTYHEVLMVCGPLGRGVAYWGFLGGVLLIGESFPPLGENCHLLSNDSLGIDANSIL